jgi:hypothetical protein
VSLSANRVERDLDHQLGSDEHAPLIAAHCARKQNQCIGERAHCVDNLGGGRRQFVSLFGLPRMDERQKSDVRLLQAHARISAMCGAAPSLPPTYNEANDGIPIDPGSSSATTKFALK